MNDDMKLYYDYTISPLGQLFYKQVFKQLEVFKNKIIFDFGSGFGFTSNFLAKNNTVIALEQDSSMIDSSSNKNNYQQIHGNLDEVKKIQSKSFDIVLCHLVLEFVDNQEEILKELVRILKDDGILSIINHNRNGRIIQALVQDCDFEDTQRLLDDGFSYSSAFGDIKFYNKEQLFHWIGYEMNINFHSGIRVLASLHDSKTQAEENWLEKMFILESQLLQREEFIAISYFNHYFLKKK